MDILDIAVEVGRMFPSQRKEQFTKNPLANMIRDEWPTSFLAALFESERINVVARASPGQGQWNAAPFMAFLHASVTTSPQRGYYPVILYERGFKSFCLVMAQGADVLRATFGAKEALNVLISRVQKLQDAGGDWQASGFEQGPFATFSKGDSGSENDPWAASIAFGKRYEIASPPSSSEFTADLLNIIRIYQDIVTIIGDEFELQDATAKALLASGELPTGPTATVCGHDGAMKVAYHKKIESRTRNTKLIKLVKDRLGCRCQGCGVNLGIAYGKIGQDFIEAHHMIPLHTMPKEGAELSVKDFSVLCPTCHRMIHRLGCPALPVLRKAIHWDLLHFHKELSQVLGDETTTKELVLSSAPPSRYPTI